MGCFLHGHFRVIDFAALIMWDVESFICYLPGYMNPPMMPPMMAPPGAPSLPGQMNGVPRPPTMIAQPNVPGSTAAPTPSGPPSMGPPVTYQANQAATTSGGFDSFNVNATAPEANH